MLHTFTVLFGFYLLRVVEEENLYEITLLVHISFSSCSLKLSFILC